MLLLLLVDIGKIWHRHRLLHVLGNAKRSIYQAFWTYRQLSNGARHLNVKLLFELVHAQRRLRWNRGLRLRLRPSPQRGCTTSVRYCVVRHRLQFRPVGVEIVDTAIRRVARSMGRIAVKKRHGKLRRPVGIKRTLLADTLPRASTTCSSEVITDRIRAGKRIKWSFRGRETANKNTD